VPFPDAEHAIIAPEKVRDYLLNPLHPVGGPKAAWFASLGYDLSNWQDLIEDLLHIAKTSDDFVAKPSRFGVKYEATGWIGRAGFRPGAVLMVWLVEENSPPRLITAYPA